ncbi:MAG TPA: efflux RND transporter permease subunit [bacterium]|nr:efflux RND transporter permease subunit [bacterium]
MFLSNASIKRPIAMLCLIIGLTLLGINAYRKLGVELFPKIDVPYITVVTIYPGASPEQLEVDVAKKIENQVSSIAGLKHITSSCMENVVNTLLEFELGTDVDLAATDVREKIDMIKNEFPEGVEDPKIIKFDVNAKPIINIALTGAKPIEELYDYADNILRDKFSTIEGVADVSLLGGQKLEAQILLDREKLAARGLTSLDIVNVIKSNIRTIPSGRIKDNLLEYSIEFKGDFDEIEELGNLEIANNLG